MLARHLYQQDYEWDRSSDKPRTYYTQLHTTERTSEQESNKHIFIIPIHIHSHHTGKSTSLTINPYMLASSNLKHLPTYTSIPTFIHILLLQLPHLNSCPWLARGVPSSTPPAHSHPRSHIHTCLHSLFWTQSHLPCLIVIYIHSLSCNLCIVSVCTENKEEFRQFFWFFFLAWTPMYQSNKVQLQILTLSLTPAYLLNIWFVPVPY